MLSILFKYPWRPDIFSLINCKHLIFLEGPWVYKDKINKSGLEIIPFN